MVRVMRLRPITNGMKFTYEARTSEGEVQTGTVEAPSEEVALQTLQNYNLIILDISPEKSGWGLRSDIEFFSRVKRDEVVLFSRQLSVMFDAQVPLLRALRTLSNQAKSSKFKGAIMSISEEVDAGTSFAQAISRYPKIFSNFYVAVVKAGEASGRLQEVLNYLADHEEKSYDLERKVRGALIYPAFIVFSLVAVGTIMMIFVIPQITSIFDETNTALPILTVIVIAISDFMRNFWWLLIILVFGGGFGLLRFIKTPRGKAIFDVVILNIPILNNLFKKVFLARFAENLSTLIHGGIPIIEALEITGDVVGNETYKKTIKKASEEVRKGGNISTALKENKYIPVLVSQMVSVGEESGKLDFILSKLGDFYQKEVDVMVDNLTSLIQPILILVLGAAAGLMVAAILLPIYNLSSSF